MAQMIKLLRQIHWHWFYGWRDLKNWMSKRLPAIPTRRPEPPTTLCDCGKPFDRIIAIDTGDGFEFDWGCENECGMGEPIVGWFPFVFGWAKYKDLKRIGIEVH